MESTDFVLMVCIFMVIATVMMSLGDWEHAPDTQAPILQYTCSFDGFCKGADCTVALPQSIVLVLHPEDDRAFFYDEARPATHYNLQVVRDSEWVRQMDSSVMRLVLRNNGVLKYSEHAGVLPDSPVLAHGSALCHDANDKSREQG